MENIPLISKKNDAQLENCVIIETKFSIDISAPVLDRSASSAAFTANAVQTTK